MYRFGFRLTALTIALLLFGSAKAHHSSNGVYDSDRTITIQGSITRFDWKNPHLYVFVETINEDGDVVPDGDFASPGDPDYTAIWGVPGPPGRPGG